MAIKAIFFDIGSVLLNEDYLRFKEYELLWYELRKFKPQISFKKILAMRETLIRRYGDNSPNLTIAKQLLPENAHKNYLEQLSYYNRRYKLKYIKPVPGIRYVLQNLSHYYQLGIIANQPAEVREILRRHQLDQFFQSMAISEEIKLRKPNPKIFVWALSQLKCEANQAIMIGDRIDHDVVPAKKLGMKTILARFHLQAKGIFPQEHREKLYFESLQKVPNWPQQPNRRDEIPDAVASSPEELMILIPQLDQPQAAGSSSEKESQSRESFWDFIREMMEETGE